MLASYELYLENHEPLETYAEWQERMKDVLDIEKINSIDAFLEEEVDMDNIEVDNSVYGIDGYMGEMPY